MKSETPKVKYDDSKFGFIRIGSFCFAPGFRSVSWSGKYLFPFTRTQAEIVSLLVEYLENGFPEVPQHEIIRHMNDSRFDDEDESQDRRLNTDARLRDFFRISKSKPHPAWQTLIKTTKGRDSRMYIDLNWLPDIE